MVLAHVTRHDSGFLQVWQFFDHRKCWIVSHNQDDSKAKVGGMLAATLKLSVKISESL